MTLRPRLLVSGPRHLRVDFASSDRFSRQPGQHRIGDGGHTYPWVSVGRYFSGSATKLSIYLSLSLSLTHMNILNSVGVNGDLQRTQHGENIFNIKILVLSLVLFSFFPFLNKTLTHSICSPPFFLIVFLLVSTQHSHFPRGSRRGIGVSGSVYRGKLRDITGLSQHRTRFTCQR